ncbi:hypothetical protein ACOSQ3_009019 [Xanthoceras sorbifolium]
MLTGDMIWKTARREDDRHQLVFLRCSVPLLPIYRSRCLAVRSCLRIPRTQIRPTTGIFHLLPIYRSRCLAVRSCLRIPRTQIRPTTGIFHDFQRLSRRISPIRSPISSSPSPTPKPRGRRPRTSSPARVPSLPRSSVADLPKPLPRRPIFLSEDTTDTDLADNGDFSRLPATLSPIRSPIPSSPSPTPKTADPAPKTAAPSSRLQHPRHHLPTARVSGLHSLSQNLPLYFLSLSL